MSHLALRRVMIRLLHDPAFATALYADPERALRGSDVDATERGWLTLQPPAAWRADPARPARVLAALAEEYPAAVDLDPAHAAGFLRSPQFHAAIQERGSLALAFGAYLGSGPDPRARVLAALERAIAIVRRAPATPVEPRDGDRLRLTSRAVVVRARAGALALLADVRAGRPGTPLGTGEEPVLVALRADGQATVEALPPALAALLEAATHARLRSDLLAEARRQGAGEGEDAEIVDGLIFDGLLVAADETGV